MAILSKGCKPGNFESRNSLKLSFTNIRGLRSNLIECESFVESNFLDILALCETNLDDSIGFGKFSVRGSIRKDSFTHMHSLAVYVKEGLPFAQGLLILNYVFNWLTSLSVLLLFPLSITFFCLYARFLIILSNIDEVLSINPSADVFVFGNFIVHHKAG